MKPTKILMLGLLLFAGTSAIGNATGPDPTANEIKLYPDNGWKFENIHVYEFKAPAIDVAVIELNFVCTDEVTTGFPVFSLVSITASVNLVNLWIDPGLCGLNDSYSYNFNYVKGNRFINDCSYPPLTKRLNSAYVNTGYRCRSHLHVDPGSC